MARDDARFESVMAGSIISELERRLNAMELKPETWRGAHWQNAWKKAAPTT